MYALQHSESTLVKPETANQEIVSLEEHLSDNLSEILELYYSARAINEKLLNLGKSHKSSYSHAMPLLLTPISPTVWYN